MYRGWDGLPLAHGIAEDRHVRALCDCGASAVIDVSMWVAEGSTGLQLSSFEDRVRCGACGARRVPLQIWHQKARPTLQTAIYVFR
jgi:hypothetical protein